MHIQIISLCTGKYGNIEKYAVVTNTLIPECNVDKFYHGSTRNMMYHKTISFLVQHALK